MPLIRSTGGKAMLTRAGGPMVNSPSNVAAPPIVSAPGALSFDMAQSGTAMRGWYGSNNQFENYLVARDWTANFADQAESFAGIRWQPTFDYAMGWTGQWETSGGDVRKVTRKGTTGADARTLVFECDPNPAAIPVGDPVVFWSSFSEGDYSASATLNLSGYNLPLRQKLTVTRSVGSAYADTNGRRIIEIDTGQALPDISFVPGTYSIQGWWTRTQLQFRHWSFYKDTATKALRHPLGPMTDLSLNSVLGNGGYLVLGGQQGQPTWIDKCREWNLLGHSLIEEYVRLEAEGLANYFGNTDPRKCAVETENETIVAWNGESGMIGSGPFLKDVVYPIFRKAFGPDRTIILKCGGWGGLNVTMSDFDFAVPSGEPANLCIHNYDQQITGLGGQLGFTDITQTDWIADQLRSKIASLGFRGGGATEIGVDAGRANGDTDRGQRMGRLLTSFTKRDLYAFGWTMTGDGVRCSKIQDIGGKQIEAFDRGMAPYCRRAGLMTT
jgi:hypothetical protein